MATSSGVACQVCYAQHITNDAEYWCPECREGLCSDCYKYHSNSKVLKTHVCIPIDQYNKLPSSVSDIHDYCPDHDDKYTNYCSHHDNLCCPICISTTHAECKGFLSVKEILRTAKRSTLLYDMEQTLNDLDRNIEKVIQDRKNILLNVTQQRQNCYYQIKQLRDKINKHLDALEHKLMCEFNAVENMQKTKIESLLCQLSREKNITQALLKDIECLKLHASDFQTFLGSKKYQKEVERAQKYMTSLLEDGSLEQFSLKWSTDSKILEILHTSTFGSIIVESTPPTLILKTELDKHAQFMAVIAEPLRKSVNDIKLSLLKRYNIPTTGIAGYRGCIIHSSGKLIIAESSMSKLLELNANGEVEKRVLCSGKVNDVTTIDDKTIAVSTEKGIDMFDINSNQTENLIKTSNRCYGITYHKGTLLWCEQLKGLQRMDLTDRNITTLVKQDELPSESYITTYGDQIYQTNFKTKTVTCYTIMGDVLWEYRDASVLHGPFGIAVDSNGNIYVTSFNANDVVVISADGKDGKKLLGQQEGLEYPYGIYFEKTKNNVLIVNHAGIAFLYHVEQENV